VVEDFNFNIRIQMMKNGIKNIVKEKPKFKIEAKIPKLDLKLNQLRYKDFLNISKSITLNE